MFDVGDSDGLRWDTEGLAVCRAGDLATILSSSHCIQSSHLVQSKEDRDSSSKALLVSGGSMSFVTFRDVADGANSPLELEVEVSVEDSLKEGGSRSGAEEHSMKPCL